MGTLAGGELDQQSLHRRDLDGFIRHRLAQHGQPFLRRKQRLLLIVNCDRHNDLIKKRARPFDNVEMTIRHRIETARINRASHNRTKLAEEIENVKEWNSRLRNDEVRMTNDG